MEATLNATAEVDGVFTCLDFPMRRAILRQISAHEELHVAEIGRAVGLRQQAVSHHLKIFSLRRLVGMDRRGKCNFYRLTDLGRKAIQILEFAEGPDNPPETGTTLLQRIGHML